MKTMSVEEKEAGELSKMLRARQWEKEMSLNEELFSTLQTRLSAAAQHILETIRSRPRGNVTKGDIESSLKSEQQTVLQEAAGTVGTAVDQIQTLFDGFFFPIRLRLYRKDAEERMRPLGKERMQVLQKERLRRDQESARWQHQMALFLLINQRNPRLGEIMGSFWKSLEEITERIGEDLEDVSKERRGIARVVGIISFFRRHGYHTMVSSEAHDVRRKIDLWFARISSDEKVLCGVQVKPNEKGDQNRVRIQAVPYETEKISELESGKLWDVIIGMRQTMVDLRKINQAYLPLKPIVLYIRMPSGDERPNFLYPETGLPESEAFYQEVSRDIEELDKNTKFVLRIK